MVHRTLLLMRQGKGVKRASGIDARLRDRGKRKAQRMGVWIAQQGWIPDQILAAPTPCAVVSAEKAAKAMGIGVQQMVVNARLDKADMATLLDELTLVPETVHTLMLVGDGVGLEQLIVRLVANGDTVAAGGRKLLKHGSLAVLKWQGAWAELEASAAELVDLIDVRSLPKRFPFPDAQGAELRDRPAYYYRQSSVIPYRRATHGLEVLLMGSSKKHHWGVPKGIHEPGMSAQESAAKEAVEEAGVRGRIDQRLLGVYDYEKWGNCCRVEVFAMEVTELLAEDLWQESHRGRQWVAVETAVGMVKAQQLVPLMRRLAELVAA
ncbi:MAG: NUDIX domain-containing protein [Mariprofundales bacterium]|nr:NUDIX domain-containing protein [Mariprofundales bacterium]